MILVAQAQGHHLLISILEEGVELGFRLMIANCLLYPRSEIRGPGKLGRGQRDHDCIELIDQKLFLKRACIQAMN